MSEKGIVYDAFGFHFPGFTPAGTKIPKEEI
jgi:hypothetical protein